MMRVIRAESTAEMGNKVHSKESVRLTLVNLTLFLYPTSFYKGIEPPLDVRTLIGIIFP